MRNSSTLASTAEVAFRWYVFLFLNVYGLGKMAGMQFYRRGALPAEVAARTLEEASAFELGWTFMGYSFGYILFVGISQVLGAWLLLWPKTKLLGVAILLPILVNIIAFDIVFLDQKGALAAAIIYLSMLLYVLYYNRSQVTNAFLALTAGAKNGILEQPGRWRGVLYALLFAALTFGFDQAIVSWLGR